MLTMSAFAKPGAYDYNATVFSPDGRLYQVEYAMEVVNRGGTILGIKCTEGVVLGSEENAEPLETSGHSWKIFPIDDHIGAAIVGLGSDARVLIDRARVTAQSNKLTYDESIDVEIVTKNSSDFQQVYTQHGGGRPFGTALIFAGVDSTGARVLATHPSGTYRAYKAVALGAGRETVQAMLTENYRDNLTLDDSVKLAVKCLKNSLVARELPIKIKIAVISVETKKMKLLTEIEIDDIVKEIS
jgi:proteasome alpha subunit